MNYTWKKSLETGQKAIGFLEMYETTIKGANVKAIVNYLPQFLDRDEKNAHVTLFFEGAKKKLTQGLFHSIYDDLCDIVKSNERMKYQERGKPFSYLFTQTFLVDKIPELEYFTHGDYSYMEPKKVI